ncbi:extracellular solute-binding protein [Evansella sp. AB-P1]|uniref:ABC transporter substrate-binding protein n=1 Tax=Evansella sp. AB-P1 TaxID=3037653 RepID=UPI00242040B6|nr:extracellular solute-binding protein [Evansella sp. AB-P1]MDG5788493.1 extracellular solute-binding protein [Evansella sp. AB-P1]
MMNAMKKLFCLIFILMIFSLVACNSDGSTSGDGGDGNEEVTLTLLLTSTQANAGMEAVIEEIENRYNIITEVEIRPAGTEGDNLVKTRLATGDMTDIMVYNTGALFDALNPEEYFADLSDEPFMETIEETFLDTVTVDGKSYGIPVSTAQAGGWIYNKKVYEELGLSVPTTWDELMANNQVIKDAGIVPVVASFRDTWTSQLILLADYYNVHSVLPTFADDYTHNKAKFADTPVALRGFEKMQEIHDAGFFNNEETATSYEDAIRMVGEGSAVHYPILTQALPAFSDDHINDIGVFGQPGDDPDNHGLTLWMPNGVYINKEIENFDAAKTWFEFFVSQDGQDLYMTNFAPQGPSVVKGIELPDDVYPAVKDMLTYVQEGRVEAALEFHSPLKGPNLEQILVEVGLGMTSADDAAENYDRDVLRQARQLGLDGW